MGDTLRSPAMLGSEPVGVDRSAAAGELSEAGFVHLRGPRPSKQVAWSHALAVFHEATTGDPIGADMPRLSVVGRFTIPPLGARRRDFQALHMDFGLPVAPGCPTDVARFTALYVDPALTRTTAMTRIAPLRRLLSQRAWAQPEDLVERLRRYGAANAGDGAENPAGYVEGIFARLVEAVDDSPTLPRSGERGFLCGMEFESVAAEQAHLADRGLDLDTAERRVRVAPGQLLLLDNLATAHGRLGIREPLELHQLCVGFRDLDVPRQCVLLSRVLAAFS
jgi:hypothetical protein